LVDPNGGTDVDRAMDEAATIIRDNPAPMNKADVILITDGVSGCEQSEHIRENLHSMGASAIGFGISTPRESLLPWCDTVFGVEDLRKIGEGAADALFAQE
jgi:hypothetical protein